MWLFDKNLKISYDPDDQTSLNPIAYDDGFSPPPEYGKPFDHDPSFRGPIRQRRFTDVACFILFSVFLLFWIVLAIFGFLNGDPQRLSHPTDSDGRECGMGRMVGKRYLYYFDITKCARADVALNIRGCNTPQVCVAACPNVTKVMGNSGPDREWFICKSEIDHSTRQTADPLYLVRMGYCAPYVIASVPILNRCIPSVDKDLINVLVPQENIVTNYSNQDVATGTKHLAQFLKFYQLGESVFHDITEFWWMYLLGLLFSMVVALLWIVLMRWLAGFMIILNFFIVVAALSFGIYYCFTAHKQFQKPNLPVDKFGLFRSIMAPDNIFVNIMKDKEKVKKLWFSFGVILSILLGILVFLTITCITRIRIAIALIREASKAISLMFSTLFWPIAPFIGQIAIICFWAALAIYLASSGYPYYQTLNLPAQGLGKYAQNFTQCQPEIFNEELVKAGIDPNATIVACQFVSYQNHPWYPYMQAFNLFGLLWAVFFINALNQITLAGAFASYYWARNKYKDIPMFVLSNSFWTAIVYHIGSLAFGSLLLAITKIIRLALEYLQEKLDKFQNPVCTCILRCTRCCFWIFEKFLKFLNKNAFIMMAIHGKNFCQSAGDAFTLIMRNAIRVVVINKTTDFLLFMGQLVVMATTGYFFYYLYTTQTALTPLIPKFRVWEFSLVVQIFGAYLVSHIFFGVYEMAVDTLFLCFLEDCERNDGSPYRPYYMSKELGRILHKKNR